jgi:peptidoglycan lytic transglycosylase G
MARARRERVTRTRRTAIVVIALIVVPLLVLASGAIWFWWQLNPPGGPGAKVELQIVQGWGVPRIGDELAHAGVIDSSLVFNIYSRLNGDTKFKPGTYELKKHMGVSAAVKALKAGPRVDYTKLTIPPGLWLKEVAQRVGKMPGKQASAFLQASQNNAVRSPFEPDGIDSLEGLLWPDTYKVSAEEDEIEILKTMEATFETKAGALGLAQANVQGHGPYDIIKIASLIESEAKTAADRPLIASVIYNRLAQGMKLQIDATLIYARGDPKNRRLSDADKAIVSPYNTYKIDGLPPTPIAAVSEASLRAALAPAQSDFLYYVVIDKAGNHAFARTLAEHEHNIQIARQAGVLP